MKAAYNKYGKFVGVVGTGVAVLSPLSAFAAVDPAITTAITGMQTDGVTVASAFLGAIIAIIAVKFLRKGL